MNLLAHRGLWNKPEEKNSLQAIQASFIMGIGIETDIRDCDGNLVVSHDPPTASCALPLDALLQCYVQHEKKPILALNIKADGLHMALLKELQRYQIDNYFVFDMSIPDTLGYMRLHMPFAARISEYERTNVLANDSPWIWLDAFHSEWFDNVLIERCLGQGQRVAIVSPELHGRPHLPLWKQLQSLSAQSQVYLCTDLIVEAREFFDADKN